MSCAFLSFNASVIFFFPKTYIININIIWWSMYIHKHPYFHLLSIFKHALQTRLCFKNPKVEGLTYIIAWQFMKDLSMHGGILTTWVMCKNKKKQKRLKQVKHGSNNLTPLGIVSQSRWGESNHSRNGYKATLQYQNWNLWQSCWVWHMNAKVEPRPILAHWHIPICFWSSNLKNGKFWIALKLRFPWFLH